LADYRNIEQASSKTNVKKIFNLHDLDLKKKKFSKFIQTPFEFKKLGGNKDYPFLKLMLKTLKRININF